VLLVTISDITKRLEAEQQLIQASKMATLGEMATGVAHELNQPLSVIKTASSFFMRKAEEKRAHP
jgi:histidine kinase